MPSARAPRQGGSTRSLRRPMADPGGILGEIVVAKRREAKERLAATSLESLRARAVPTKRSLKASLVRPGARFVFEVKRRSPSLGMLAPGVDAAEVAQAYCGAADAISVLIDQAFFGGSLEDLAR